MAKPTKTPPVAKTGKPGRTASAGRKRVAPKSKTLAAARDAPVLSFATPGAWSTWIAAHCASPAGVWLKVAKKGSTRASVTYPEALEIALAWGWIDGQRGKRDATWSLIKFTPRRARSIWSKINCAAAERLIASGAMQPPGLAEVERAKRDGRWDAAYESQSRSVVPNDLAAALAANAPAALFFETLDSANRYAVLFRLHTAKKAETRAARLEKFVAMLARHEKLHP